MRRLGLVEARADLGREDVEDHGARRAQDETGDQRGLGAAARPALVARGGSQRDVADGPRLEAEERGQLGQDDDRGRHREQAHRLDVDDVADDAWKASASTLAASAPTAPRAAPRAIAPALEDRSVRIAPG